METAPLVLISLAWLAYALLHSALASFAAKAWLAQRWPQLMPWYRLGFNIVALVTLLPIAWLTYALDGPLLWQWQGAWRWLSHGLAAAAVAGFVAVSRSYDMPAFLGLRQVREHAGGRIDRIDHEGLRISAWHRYVRHPWYFCGLVLVWSGDKNAPLLLSAVAITLYFIVGARLEEQKLIAMHGDAYRRYMAKVPALIPLPWKSLSREEAGALSGPPHSSPE